MSQQMIPKQPTLSVQSIEEQEERNIYQFELNPFKWIVAKKPICLKVFYSAKVFCQKLVSSMSLFLLRVQIIQCNCPLHSIKKTFEHSEIVHIVTKYMSRKYDNNEEIFKFSKALKILKETYAQPLLVFKFQLINNQVKQKFMVPPIFILVNKKADQQANQPRKN